MRRTPKVYNALITTDENLTPSRAFPVIQPTIHETGIASFPFGVPYSPYRVYNPAVRFAPPYPQVTSQYSHTLKKPLIFESPSPQIQYQQAFPPQNFPPVPDQVGPNPNELGPPQPPNPQQPMLPTPLPPQQGMPPQNNMPPPQGPFGLPPNLIPLNQFPNPQNPVYLPPFAYPNYPIIPDGHHQRFPDQYLPPYEYLPPGFPFGFRPPSNKPPPKKYPGNPNKESSESAPEKVELSLEADEEDDVTTQIPLKNIKNGNKNSKVPDVPPPPIPGKHKKHSQKS